jgi:hypothetical protein
MKKSHILLLILLALSFSWKGCKQDFLNVAPRGSLDQTLLQSSNGVEALLIGAYSLIDGVSNGVSTPLGEWETTSSNWVFGSIRGMEANKGTDAGDQPEINQIQTFSETSTNQYINDKWRAVYEAISRCNSVLVLAKKTLDNGKMTQDEYDSFVTQAKALRGWYHFEAWRMWEKIPYVDETVDPATVTNDADPRAKIIADLTVGTTLPNNMGAIGKFNGTVCKVLLAKALMQMNHDYAGAKTLLLDVVATGTQPGGKPIGLAPTYGEIFDIPNRNGIESVYTVQYSVNDGSGANNAGSGEVLNFPYKSGGSPAGCCGFFDPTQEFVNSFRTSPAGLPLLDNSYNLQPVKNDFGLPANKTVNANKLAVTDPGFTPDAGPLDPRLDWTVGRRGIPYWDWGLHTGADWIRDPTYSGPYNTKKQVYQKSQEGQYTDISSWTPGYTANGYRMIRYADVLLLLAECQIESTPADLAGALANINLVRARAANPAGWVKKIDADGAPTAVPAANYVISPYTTLGTVDNARKALQMERKLELGMEGHRYFDLNRWGITVTELNRILTYEKTMPWGNKLYGNAVVGPEDVRYPVPQRQIDLSLGKISQNTGH